MLRVSELTPGPWLTPAEQEAWRAFLISSQLLVAALDRQLQRDAGIPHAWFALLVVLAEHPNRTARQSELAGIAEFSLSRLSYAITRLADRGWVTRTPDPDDRRATLVTLTDAGVDALATIAPAHVALVRELLFARLSGRQVSALHEACRAILAGLPDAPMMPSPAPTPSLDRGAEHRVRRLAGR